MARAPTRPGQRSLPHRSPLPPPDLARRRNRSALGDRHPGFRGLADDGDISEEVFEQIEAEVRPSDLMVMIHTSGATADPKAVVHTHGAQIRHAWSLAQLYGFTEDVRTFTTMPFFWVGGLTVCLLSHLHVGAAVITVERMDPPAMVELIDASERPASWDGPCSIGSPATPHWPTATCPGWWS